jgi:alanyl-tRNA synthetase
MPSVFMRRMDFRLKILKENSLSLKLDKFKQYLKRHSIDSKSKTVFDKKVEDIDLYSDILNSTKTEFVGYESERHIGKVNSIIEVSAEKKSQSQLIEEGQKAELILDKTPFYAEKGGQVGDGGLIVTEKSTFLVENTTMPVEGLIVHSGKVIEGKIHLNDKVEAKVDPNFRKNISKNHTATHLLHWALRSIFGKEVTQAGSLVSNEKLRFDYNLYAKGFKDSISRIEKMVNEKIQKNDLVKSFETTKEYADEIGVISLFEEKYGKYVRVVELGSYSRELCGGTHVRRTGEIGLFKIISDTGIGANLRRIEALTSMRAFDYLNKKCGIIQKIHEQFDIDEEKVIDHLVCSKEEIESLRQELSNLLIKLTKEKIISLNKIEEVDGISLLKANLADFPYHENLDVKKMSVIGDEVRDVLREKRTILILGNIVKEKPVIVLQKNANVGIDKIDCSTLAKEAGKIIMGGGGGKEHFAHAGGQDPRSLNTAMGFLGEKIRGMIKNADESISP